MGLVGPWEFAQSNETEAFVTLFCKPSGHRLALAILAATLAVAGLVRIAPQANAQQPPLQPPQPPPELKPQKPPAPPPIPKAGSPDWELWKSQSTGREYRVRAQGDTLYAEWVNLPPAYSEHGAYIRTECHRVGAQWIGTSRSLLPCTREINGKEQIANWCPLVTRTEITAIAPDRITGRGQSLRQFDCQTCKVLETGWADFVWVPEKRNVTK